MLVSIEISRTIQFIRCANRYCAIVYLYGIAEDMVMLICLLHGPAHGFVVPDAVISCSEIVDKSSASTRPRDHLHIDLLTIVTASGFRGSKNDAQIGLALFRISAG